MKNLLALLAFLGMLGTAHAQEAVSYPNEGATGTTVGKLAKFTAANPSTAILSATTDVDNIVGIVVAQDATATTGNAKIAVLGPANCTFDASGATAGHYVINSAVTAGACADGGASRPTATQVIGRVTANVAASASGSVNLTIGFTNAGGGGSGANPTATASDVAVNGVASTFLRSDGAPAIQKTSSSVFGLAKVDGTTITASGGVITATAGGSGCTVSGGAGAVYNTGSSACTTATDQQFATGLLTLGVNTSEAGNLKLFGGTSGNVTLAPTAVAGTNVVATFPANTGTLAELNLGQSWTATQTMTAAGPLVLGANSGNVGSIKLFGNTSGDATIVVPAAAGTATRFQLPATNGSSTNVLQTDGSGNTSWVAAGGSSVVRSYLAGLGLSNDGGTPNSVVDIAAGTAADSTNAVMMTLGAFTKSTAGAWASGTAGNGMGNGLTIAASTWYHVILANNGGTPDIYFDTSVSGANRPAGISDVKVRRIGSFLTNGSSQIIAFSQLGDDFLWKAVVADLNNVTVTDTPSLHVLTVPTGLQVIAHVRSEVGTTSGTCLLSSPDENSVVANATLGNSSYAIPSGAFNFAVVDLRTDTSAEIRTACSAAVSNSMYLVTYGWIDRRGRDN